jgi:hypothetical protein
MTISLTLSLNWLNIITCNERQKLHQPWESTVQTLVRRLYFYSPSNYPINSCLGINSPARKYKDTIEMVLQEAIAGKIPGQPIGDHW